MVENLDTAPRPCRGARDQCLDKEVIDFLKSNMGIFTTATLGLVFQLVGVVLVVRDLMRAHGTARRFTKRMNLIEKAHQDLQDDSMQVARERTQGDDEAWATMIRPAVEIDLRARKVELVTQQIITYLLSEIRVPNRWKTWIGPASLLLGVALAYTASMLSIR
ncbi:hypothetical protein [Nocardia jejuensis]|uniref:hypothetical protein n=1 Tax=Nocardia jejuensis TaxID=328049 RepID=UPI00082B1F3D|nr:hypothetical protein [Nocardia jejuensis]